MRTVKVFTTLAITLPLAGFWAIPCLAQEPGAPEGLLNREAASSGSTEVATTGFEAASERHPQDTTEFEISAGGLAAMGNSKSLALTSSGRVRLRRSENQFSAALAGNYGRAANKVDPAMRTTVENLQAKARYDRFLAGDFAVFGAASLRRDRFQGIDLRLNLDPGVAYYFVDQKSQQFWGELGYDLQYDIRRQEVLDAAPLLGRTGLQKTNTRHSGRAFVGYENSVSKSVSFSTGLEYIQPFEYTENFRISWDAGIHSAVGKGFSVATTVALKYDNKPLPGVEDTDLSTAVSLAYLF